MNDTNRRVVGYGLTALVGGALLWAAFLRHTPPDLGTLLGGVDMQLRMAYAIPAFDRDGRPLSQRQAMLDDVDRQLAEAERQAPDLAMVREFRGFLFMLRGDHAAAARCYREARSLQGVDDDMHDTLVFNEARMLGQAGQPAQALALFETELPSLQPRFVTQCDIERAGLLHELGRDAAAATLLRGVLGREPTPAVTVRVGEQFERMQRFEVADQAFRDAAAKDATANYYRARLKLRLHDVDSCLQLLELAEANAPAVVRRLVQQDRQTWQAVAADDRFRQWLATAKPPVTPVR